MLKNVKKEGNKIISLEVIQRIPINDAVKCNGFDKFLSEDIKDWYTPSQSLRFKKNIITFNGRNSVYLDSRFYYNLH
jgi:hypothetical protein